MKVILASQSPYRQAILKAAGIVFTAIKPDIDEEAEKDPNLAPKDLCVRLAALKAQSLKSRFPDAVIIGSDQIAELDGQALGKPGSVPQAEAQLSRLQGRTHELLTAIHVIAAGREESHLTVTKITIRQLTPESIKRYIEIDRPLDCAGSYKLEKAGICLIEKIEGGDQTAIVGLPMMALTEIFLKLGLGFPYAIKQP